MTLRRVGWSIAGWLVVFYVISVVLSPILGMVFFYAAPSVVGALKLRQWGAQRQERGRLLAALEHQHAAYMAGVPQLACYERPRFDVVDGLIIEGRQPQASRRVA